MIPMGKHQSSVPQWYQTFFKHFQSKKTRDFCVVEFAKPYKEGLSRSKVWKACMFERYWDFPTCFSLITVRNLKS